MAKTFTNEAPTLPQETKKQRKKQAKREAKLMLRIEQAQKDMQRAEQKVARAQANLEDCKTRLRDLQEKHAQMRSPQDLYPIPSPTAFGQEQLDVSEMISSSAQQNGQTEQGEPAQQGTAIPPAEGRDDILPEDSASDGQSEEEQTPDREQQHDELRIESGGGSMPIETSNEYAWPPPKIREELAESIEEEMAHSSTSTEHDATTTESEASAETSGHSDSDSDKDS